MPLSVRCWIAVRNVFENLLCVADVADMEQKHTMLIYCAISSFEG